MKAKFFYTGIRVKDLEASVKFYTTLLGMKVRGRNTVDAAKGTVVELVCEGEGGNTLELNYYEKGSSFDTKYEVGEGLDHLAFAIKDRSEEHTSELQSLRHLVCRLLLDKKKRQNPG